MKNLEKYYLSSHQLLNMGKPGNQDHTKLMSSIEKKLDKLTESFKTEQEKSKTRHQELRDDIRLVVNRVNKLEERMVSVEKDKHKKTKEITVLRRAILELQQQALSLDIVVKGIPEIERNNNELQIIVQTLFSAIDCSTHINDVTDVRRIGRKQSTDNNTATSNVNNRPIVIKMKNNDYKQIILKAKRKKQITCADIIINNQPIGNNKQSIYMDERLIREYSNLHFEARKLKSKGSCKYVWVSNGSIYIRKDDTSAAIKITDVDQIYNFLHPNQKEFKASKRGRSSSSDNGSPSESDDDENSNEEMEEDGHEENVVGHRTRGGRKKKSKH